MAFAVSSGGAMENFSGKNQDAATFDRFAAAPVYCVYGSGLFPAFDAAADASSFCRLLCAAHGTGRPVPWSQNADIDMDQRDRTYQAGRAGHDHIIWRFRVYDTAVCWIYAPARMDIGLLRVYKLLCGRKSAPIRLGLSVAAKKRCGPFFGSVMANYS